MEKEKINQKLAKLIAFVSPKGGTGKSTYTTLLASWLHYVEKKKVVVVDCDTQQSIIDLKTREENFLSRLANEKFKNRIAKEHEVNGKAYPITIGVTSLSTISELDAAYPDVDYFVFDTPGTILGHETLKTTEDAEKLKAITSFYFNMDMLICPLTQDPNAQAANMAFLNDLLKIRNRTSTKPKTILCTFTTDAGARGSYAGYYINKTKLIRKRWLEGQLYYLYTQVPHVERFKREMNVSNQDVNNVFRTTHFFPKSAMTIDTNIKYLLEEIFVLLEEGANVWFDKFNF